MATGTAPSRPQTRPCLALSATGGQGSGRGLGELDTGPRTWASGTHGRVGGHAGAVEKPARGGGEVRGA